MRVNLLGPFEVCTGDDLANSAPAAQKVRQILAVLALNANKSVRTSQLVEELWDDNPPASAGTALQTYVYQIRKKFGLGSPRGGPVRKDGEVPVLSTIDGGYHLALPRDRVDAFRFEPLVSQARAEFRAGDFLRARNSVGAALTLWRDAALVDVRKGSLLEAEALRLNELYCSARDLRISADLSLGRHHELLGELTSLAQREPMNEAAQRHLMLALYRADRRADALRVYQRARTCIAEELGLDPSPELEALHVAILGSDDSLMAANEHVPALAQSAATPVHAPCHLPAPQARLIGRRGQLARMTNALTAPTAERSIVTVSGPVGSGKSELSLHAAQQVRGHYPDGQLFGSLLGGNGRPADHARILRSFLRGLGAAEEQLNRDITDLSLMFRTLTADRRVLVVLDDVSSPEELPSLLPAGKGCGAIISTRRRLFVPSSTEDVELDRLPLEDSVQILADAVGNHRITMDPAGIRHLAELCHGLPGAVLSIAAKLRLRPHWAAGQAIAWIIESSRAHEDPLAIRPRVNRTLTGLTSDGRTAFDALFSATDSAQISPESAALVLGTDKHRAENLLEELVEAYLLRLSPMSSGSHFSYAWEPATETLRALGTSPDLLGIEPARAKAA